MKNHYAQAISVLQNMKNDTVPEKMLHEIAKKHPKIVTDVYMYITNGVDPSIREECESLIRAEKFILAVKRYREMTGASLQVAKSACEEIRNNMEGRMEA